MSRLSRARTSSTGSRSRVHRRDPGRSIARCVPLDADDDDVFVEAYAREIYAIAIADKTTLRRASSTRSSSCPAPNASPSAPVPQARCRARLANDVGVARLAVDDRKGARMWFERASRRSTHPATPSSPIGGNLALVADEPGERDRAFADDRRYRSALGDDHPLTLEARLAAAVYTTEPLAEASSSATSASGCSACIPTLVETVDDYFYELGWLAEERGDTGEAHDRSRRFASRRTTASPPATSRCSTAARRDPAMRARPRARGFRRRMGARRRERCVRRHRDERREDRTPTDAIASLTRALRLLEKIDDMPQYRRRSPVAAPSSRLVAKSDHPRSRSAELAAACIAAPAVTNRSS
jgi:hypothetical protein